ncbi:polysaccharide pyruvyl transferase family protein [Brevibacterium oceani]|uniref:polysaccharide pyruvyl transferase family protein n=1 Tax=Brevibacterium oceani TaxID=358099 RepID=UPI0015E62E5D|nr:polysaccharide pyruvyl transferase family protein [Brevibacterium oceani]
MNPLRILLLTNRDSDNVGDQIIEATVISIIKGVMKNLGFAADDFTISSRAAGIISKKYMKTEDPELLKVARKAISESDLIIFGGAPLFNYAYQNFYRRTIVTLELAQEYGVPVLFSSIGVERFDAENPKSQALKSALQLPIVKQITTRDDIDSVRRYVEGTDIPTAHVADPAVLADIVYRENTDQKATPAPARSTRVRIKRKIRRVVNRLLADEKHKQTAASGARATSSSVSPSQSAAGISKQGVAAGSKRKCIGLVVTRAGIFADNGIKFTGKDQREFWLNTISKLTERGYDYRVFTTGHFTDEVFLDNLVKNGGLQGNKAAVNVNSPEELIEELRRCDGVIAYRLHASITSFAMGIPSIGLSWNFKVPYFYESVGYGHRALSPEQWTADEAVVAIEAAMAEGITKDEKFLKSVYDTLFTGIRDVVSPDSTAEPYNFAELWQGLPRQAATGSKAYREKVNRKLRRTYESYQRLSVKANASK